MQAQKHMRQCANPVHGVMTTKGRSYGMCTDAPRQAALMASGEVHQDARLQANKHASRRACATHDYPTDTSSGGFLRMYEYEATPPRITHIHSMACI